jgi:antitoxin HicB
MNMMKADRYPVRIFWDDDERAFLALAPDLPGCSAYGATEQETLSSIREAIEGWIEAAQAAGNLVPDPSPAPHAPNYSGKVLLRMPQTLHGQLAKAAEQEGTSLNQYIVFLLTEGHTKRSLQVAYINAAGWQKFCGSIYQFAQVSASGGIAVAAYCGTNAVSQILPPVSAQLLPVWHGNAVLTTNLES